jgi:hypothetical protein|tara:strand:- start:2178 stop:2456 length:279 start_codon:yes stop_codon:yes gene_type:complete
MSKLNIDNFGISGNCRGTQKGKWWETVARYNKTTQKIVTIKNLDGTTEVIKGKSCLQKQIERDIEDALAIEFTERDRINFLNGLAQGEYNGE